MTTKTPDLSQADVAKLSPAARDAYFQQKAEEGVDPNAGWLFGAVQEFIASGKAQQQSQEVGDQNVNQLTRNGDVKYVEGLEPSNADYQGYDHQRLKEFIDTDLDVDQVTSVSTAYHDIHLAFDSFATTMAKAVAASQGTWEGDAAGNAQAYFTSLSKWADGNSQNAKLASETIYDQGTAASNVKNSMPKPIPFSWKEEVGSWVTSNPFNLGENIDKSIQKQADSREAHTQAASAMHSYDNALYEAASKQPVFAEPPKFGEGGGGDPGKPQPYPVPPGTRPPGSNVPPGSGSFIPPGGNSNGFRTPGSSGNLPGPGSTTGSGSLPSSTLPSGYQNGPGPVNQPGPNTNVGPMPGPMPMAPMMNPAMGGDSDYNSRGGRGGGGGSGSGFGPGSGASSTPGSGSASGAARPGGVGAAEAAAGRGMGGLGGGAGAGRGGMGMGGGMAGRGQSAEGDEDTEHQRPTYLVEGDPDEVFGTDMRTAPPVIGE